MWADSRLSVNESMYPSRVSEADQADRKFLKRIPKLFARVSAVFYKPIKRREFIERATMNSSSVNVKQSPKEVIELPRSQEESLDFSQIILSDKGIPDCSICYAKPSDCVFFACGHGGVCYSCGLEIMKKKKKCHICRSIIEEVIQIQQNERAAYCNR